MTRTARAAALRRIRRERQSDEARRRRIFPETPERHRVRTATTAELRAAGFVGLAAAPVTFTGEGRDLRPAPATVLIDPAGEIVAVSWNGSWWTPAELAVRASAARGRRRRRRAA